MWRSIFFKFEIICFTISPFCANHTCLQVMAVFKTDLRMFSRPCDYFYHMCHAYITLFFVFHKTTKDSFWVLHSWLLYCACLNDWWLHQWAIFFKKKEQPWIWRRIVLKGKRPLTLSRLLILLWPKVILHKSHNDSRIENSSRPIVNVIPLRNSCLNSWLKLDCK